MLKSWSYIDNWHSAAFLVWISCFSYGLLNSCPNGCGYGELHVWTRLCVDKPTAAYDIDLVSAVVRQNDVPSMIAPQSCDCMGHHHHRQSVRTDSAANHRPMAHRNCIVQCRITQVWNPWRSCSLFSMLSKSCATVLAPYNCGCVTVMGHRLVVTRPMP